MSALLRDEDDEGVVAAGDEAELDVWITSHAACEHLLAALTPSVSRTNIRVDAALHLYFVQGEEGPRASSVTKFVDTVFRAFDREAAYCSMSVFKPRYRVPLACGGDRCMTREEVFASWDAATSLGKRMHRWIELALNRVGLREAHSAVSAFDGLPRTQEVTAFVTWFTSAPETRGMTLRALELPVFDSVLNGTLDALAMDGAGGAWVIDWKRNDAHDTSRRTRCRAPVSHLWDNKETKQALQLNTYAYILEQARYAHLVPHSVVGLRIVKIFPRTEEELSAGAAVLNTYIMRNDLRDEVRMMRREEMRRRGITGVADPVLCTPAPSAVVSFIDEEPVDV